MYGKLTIGSQRKKSLKFILFSDVFVGFKHINTKYSQTEEYWINAISTVQKEEQHSFVLSMYSGQNITLTTTNDEKVQRWIQKTKKLLSNNDIIKLSSQLALGLTPERVARFWKVKDKEDPKAWMTLGDLYKQEKNTKKP